MTESMQTAWSFTKSHAMSLGMKPEFFKKHDVHVHVPEGATPKDGPSAGMAIATAMVSAVTKVPVAEKIAMTGEMTLHGEILAIGGSCEGCAGEVTDCLLSNGCDKELDLCQVGKIFF